MPATPHAVAEGLQRAAGTRRFDGFRAKCRGYSILQLLQRTPEDLAACLEFRPEPKKTKTVVARDVEPRDELVEKYVELSARILG